MGIFDRIKDTAGQHADKVDAGLDTAVERAGDLVDERTGGRHADTVDAAQELVKERAGERLTDIREGSAEQAPDEAVIERLDEPTP